MAAPSGKFCSPMPKHSAIAPASVTLDEPPPAASAQARPTAMPSGMLCSVTASTSSVVRLKLVCTPSASLEPGCRWGIKASSTIRNNAPSAKPPAAGSHPGTPCSPAISMEGISRLHTLAAIITPAANPRNTRWNEGLISFLNRNTTAAPAAVIKKVKPVPSAASVSAFIFVTPSTGCRMLRYPVLIDILYHYTRNTAKRKAFCNLTFDRLCDNIWYYRYFVIKL